VKGFVSLVSSGTVVSSSEYFFAAQHFLSFFKTLIGKVIIVELKNDLALKGILHSVDQYLNIKLNEMTVVDPKKYPHLVSFLPADGLLLCFKPVFYPFVLDRGEELLHSRLDSPVHPVACKRCRHSASSGRHPQGCQLLGGQEIRYRFITESSYSL
jgi:small nuclear ribonucleoprotein (snRNP)-like protein